MFISIVQTFYDESPEDSSAFVAQGSGSEPHGNVGGAPADDNARVFPMEQLKAIVGREKLCKALIHLVMADSAYVEMPKQGAVRS